ncbi:MAG TPA: hypothetical protein VGK84_10415 [Candidatus Tumulicola sp.]|jgi:hypothetical protein
MKRFGPLDRRAYGLAHRAWTDRERSIVARGLSGRMAIAIEPLLGALFFALLTWGIVWRAHHVASDATLVKIAPIFAVGAIAFLGYLVAVMVAPLAAYLQTFKPIYILDGYVRYRGRDERSRQDASGYAAALFPDRTVACEWEFLGTSTLEDVTIPSMIEFSLYAGIHKIDGRPTGLLPDGVLPTLAVGVARERFRK